MGKTMLIERIEIRIPTTKRTGLKFKRGAFFD